MENNQYNTRKKRFFLLACLFQLFCLQPTYADFINGGFEDTYTPDGTTYTPITGWSLTGYQFNGTAGASPPPPTSISQINLSTTATGSPPVILNGVTDIISGPTQTIFDYFLFGATPTPTLLLPIVATQSVLVNLRSIHAPLTKSGSGAASGFTAIEYQATSISQQITVQASDVDSTDGKVHVRYIAAPVLENPGHSPGQQPFFAFQLNNITTGRTGANPLFFQWNYSNQAGVPWKALTGAGSNSGSNTDYLYTNIQAYDIAPGNAFIHVGDVIQLVVLASGCSPGGHDGHLYLDEVGTSIPFGLWVTASGPASATPGENITYTYTYVNTETTAINNVQVVANLPLPTTASVPTSTTFVSVTTPTTGTSPSCSGTNPVTCSMGTLGSGQQGTFQLTVNIPSAWATTVGPVNNGNYPISGTGFNPLLGPLVQTALVAPSGLSDLVVNTSGLPTTGTINTPYTGTFTCSNIPTIYATGDAPLASCDITNLPTGLSVSGCTISPSNATWSEPTTIPISQTVTCTVTGSPTASGIFTATVSSDATNNSNSTTNKANATITVAGPPAIPATLDGKTVLSPAVICCGRPLILGPLPVPGTGPTTYTVTSAGKVRCVIGHTKSQTYLKMNGSPGSSCTVTGFKDGVTSAPFTVVTP